jgi:hypothetical protein
MIERNSARIVRHAAIAALCLMGVGCGLSQVGKQGSSVPVAKVTVIGNPYSSDSTGVTTTIRSGAEIQLSAADSFDPNGPIVSVLWKGMTDTSAQSIATNVNGSTVRIKAPTDYAASQTPLKFTLTVQNKDGGTASANVTVNLVYAPDANRLLLPAVATALQFNVIAATANPVPLTSDVNFVIHVTRVVKYHKSSDAAGQKTGSKSFALPDIQGKWLANVGTEGIGARQASDLMAAAASVKNPRFLLTLPAVNADDINGLLKMEPAGSAALDNQINPEDISPEGLSADGSPAAAQASYHLELAPVDAIGAPVAVLVAAGSSTPWSGVASGSGSATLDISGDDLSTALGVENIASATAYYNTVDPLHRKTSLDAWLKDNCFDSSAVGYGPASEVVHAAYTNNFDLGFGRDMYVVKGCSSDRRTKTGATIDTSQGEMATIVFNYTSLTALAKANGAFLAVAMEFRRPKDPTTGATVSTGPLLTSFYTYSPNLRNGGFTRSLSANFDGRGEKFTPGNCTTCHGGKPRTSYPAGDTGDVGAQWIPWDAGSELFADTDPSFTDQTISTGLKAADQLPNLRALNAAVINTYIQQDTGEDPAITARRSTLRSLVTGWYSNDLSAGTFNSAYVPPTWDNQPPIVPSTVTTHDLYLSVIAHNCRMCHMQRIEDTSFDSMTRKVVAALSAKPQFGQYQEFANPQNAAQFLPSIQSSVFDLGTMAASRLTMDRFWLPDGARPTAASVLAKHLGVAAGQDVTGRAIATFPRVGTFNPATGAYELDPSKRNSTVRLDGSANAFATAYQWTLAPPSGSSARLVGANGPQPAFVVDKPGSYGVTLTVTNSAGATASVTQSTALQASPPTAGVLNVSTGLLTSSTVNISVAANRSSVTPTSPVSLTYGPGTISILPPVDPNVKILSGQSQTDGSVSYPALPGGVVQVALSAQSLAVATLNYRVTDVDGNSADGKIVVTVTSDLSLKQLSLTYSAPDNKHCVTQDQLSNINGFNSSLGLTAVVVIKQSATILHAGRVGTANAPTATGTSVQYCPAQHGFVTDGNNAPKPDSFAYFVQLYNGATLVATTDPDATSNRVGAGSLATVTVNVPATSTFSNIYTTYLGGSTCATFCHKTAQPGAYWTSASGSQSTYNLLTTTPNPPTLGCPQGEGSNAPSAVCINFTAPLLSYMILKPANEATDSRLLNYGSGMQGVAHGGIKPINCSPVDLTSDITVASNWSCGTPADKAAFDAFRIWIDEGGWFN